MYHQKSNNQEGIGIYFSTDINVAKDYGPYISKTEVNRKDFIESRSLVEEVPIIKKNLPKLLRKFKKVKPEEMYYLCTDYGVEIYNPEDLRDYHIDMLVDKMQTEEIRNLQITLTESFGINDFVKIWNQTINKLGTVNSNLEFYAITKPVKLYQINK